MSRKITLAELNAGEEGIVARVEGKGALHQRLLDMGLTPGTKVMVLRLAPLGDPVAICLRGYSLTLRKEDAAKIILNNALGDESP